MSRKQMLLASTMAILMAPAVLKTVAPTQITYADTAIGTIRRDRGAVVDSYGNQTSVILPNFTSWELGQTKSINGVTYYQVATNEYIAEDAMGVNNYATSAADTDTTGGLIGTIRQGGGIAVDLNGQTTGNYLATGSEWKLGKVVLINGNQYYQISANGYVSANSIDARNLDGRLVKTPTTTTTAAVQSEQVTTKIGTIVPASKVVNGNGQENGIVLPAGSTWQLGQLKYINGNNYYQVATDEYVLANAVKTPDTTTVAPAQRTIALRYNSLVVNSNGVSLNFTLPQGSSWKIGQTKNINGHPYYQVATDEWVLATSDQSSSIFTTGPVTGTLIKSVQLYDTAANAMSWTLINGTSWKISQTVHNRLGQYFAQVSNNEWMLINGNILSDKVVSQELCDSATYEPEFGTNMM